jgi:predicted amidohydrolase/GNAT superfamily N-acetyltransferase
MEKTRDPQAEEIHPENAGTDDSHQLELRNVRASDYGDIKHIMDRVYPIIGGAWTQDEFASQLARFPEGQICIEDKCQVVAAAISVIVNYDDFGDNHTYAQITGDGHLTTHAENGDTLYGVDVFVNPDYQGLRLGRRLYDARKELCEKLNLKRIVIGARIPGYERYHGAITPQKYVGLVRSKEEYDPILSFQLANDFHIRKLVRNYLPEDARSQAWAVLLEWNNIYYEEEEVLFGGSKPVVRVGAVQWKMRRADSFEDVVRHVEYFVDVVACYKADFVLFPEFFIAPLMAEFDEANPADAIRQLASYYERVREQLIELAVAYNINIVAGSIPEYRQETLYNVSLLCRRDGSWDTQYKLHITPDERQYWGLQGGNQLRIFDTDAGKIGILICYDVEFPELARILADQDMQMLFVPYWTDTQSAYLRVERCSQARAIENECYVIISGSVGNLPNVENMDIQYSQSAMFSPSDFAFPHDAIVSQATPNTETVLIRDLDMTLLKELHEHGSVRNLRDRRRDLYRVEWVGGRMSAPGKEKTQEII